MTFANTENETENETDDNFGNESEDYTTLGQITELPSEKIARMSRELDEMRAENARLRSAPRRANKLALKVSAKGAVSIYGMGKLPVTLYQDQWSRLLAIAPEILAFISANKAVLASKS